MALAWFASQQDDLSWPRCLTRLCLQDMLNCLLPLQLH
jgi:hypothetical protein